MPLNIARMHDRVGPLPRSIVAILRDDFFTAMAS
jgi:hypothetical protein